MPIERACQSGKSRPTARRPSNLKRSTRLPAEGREFLVLPGGDCFDARPTATVDPVRTKPTNTTMVATTPR